ncbi:MAG: hypothetical protein DWQ34_22240 [Planctomycetota bacterium]|nr:MAG: hypothetical protein DWQ29_16245 [Planctomycetota bacterium]REJ88540.1 MAG: hypothetical protein DWQ34_22240 [Planctomycetota bacterium]REK22136.1 MAG: hypothetical protein DWQ41_19830 [Planctomycetota bacterium]REK34948.1 MAG: hypothetical protein DWQ45_12665 [Planctomycetota bacterium]
MGGLQWVTLMVFGRCGVVSQACNGFAQWIMRRCARWLIGMIGCVGGGTRRRKEGLVSLAG